MSGRRSIRRVDHPVEFLVGVRQPGEIALVHDRGGETRLGENHHAGGRLDQVRAGARADHQEERILDFAMQPDDAGQAAEHLPLAALAQNGKIAATVDRRRRSRTGGRLLTWTVPMAPRASAIAGRSRRAARSFRTNCVALTT